MFTQDLTAKSSYSGSRFRCIHSVGAQPGAVTYEACLVLGDGLFKSGLEERLWGPKFYSEKYGV